MIKNLSLTLDGKKILKDISINLWEGYIHAIVGANGAGKSTLASTIMGRHGYRDFKGDIIFENESIKNLPLDERAKKGITMAWQEPARFEGLRIRDFLMASDKGISDEKIDELLESVSLNPANYKNRAIDKSLSGGERKKLELASILAMKPKLVMLDEPDSGIDVSSLENIFQAIRKLKVQGITVILITHSPTVLEQAEHAFLMCCGKVVEKGKIDTILPYFKEKCIPCERPDAHELEEEGETNEK